MKKYIEHLHRRPVHEKREFAVHAAAGVIAVVFIVWFSTLGIRLLNTETTTTVADTSAASLVAATAAASQAFHTQIENAPGTVESTGGSADTAADTGSGPQTAPATVIGGPNDSATVINQ